MKHLIATILMVFAFFSLSNAQHQQDYAKVLSNPEAFRNIMMNNIKYFKAYIYDRGSSNESCKAYDCINIYNGIEFIIDKFNSDRTIIHRIGLERDRYTHIESDGTIRYVYSKYRLDVTFNIDKEYYYASCKDMNKKDSTVINCELNNSAYDFKQRHFKLSYSVISDILAEIMKLNLHYTK